ncbi:MAG: nucleotidyltransferase family protein [Candidatus Hydrothermarchaeota archaeon]
MEIQFSTHLLDKALEKKKSQREKLRLKTIKKINHVLNKLSHDIQFKEVYIFGSLTKPHRFSKNSDIDMGFIGLRDEDFFKALAFLLRELEFEVDIIQLERHRFRDKIMRESIKWTKKD